MSFGHPAKRRREHAVLSSFWNMVADDMQAVLNPWGFEPTEIRLPVHLIHGRRDTVAPPAHAEHWIETLETARPVWIEDAGHFLIEDHVEEILDAVAA